MLLLLMTPAAGAAGVSQNEEAASEEWKASFFLPPDGREMIRLKHGAESSLYDDYTPMIDYLEKYNAELDFSKAWIGTMSGNNFANTVILPNILTHIRKYMTMRAGMKK